MSIPNTISDILEFADQHADLWEQHLVELSLSQIEVDELKSLYDAAFAARGNSVNLKTLSKAATLGQNNAIKQLVSQLRALIRIIDTTAKNSEDPTSIYELAGLPVPKTPSELPAPVSPIQGRATFNSGNIELQWDGSLEQGTYFIIRRGTTSVDNNNTPYEFLANVQAKKFTDTAVPVGVASVNYEITAYRNDLSSARNLKIGVEVGSIAGGQASVTTSSAPVAEAA